jgi:hypothetical protein
MPGPDTLYSEALIYAKLHFMEVKEQHKKNPIRKKKSYICIVGSWFYVGSTNLWRI